MKLVELNSYTGTYVAVVPDEQTVLLLKPYLTDLGVESLVSIDKLHVTVLYSKRHVQVKPESNKRYQAVGTGFELFKNDDGTNSLVLLLSSPELQLRHQAFIAQGGTHTFHTYRPHLTISTDADSSIDVHKLMKPDFELVFTNEYTEALRE